MIETEWRWADPTGQQRLVRTDELRAALSSGIIAPNTPVWRAGWKEWKPAHEVPELTTSALTAANGVLANIPPPPLAVVAVQAAYENTAPHLVPPETHKIEEPPPPPRYVPAPTRARPGMFHTPSHPMRVPAGLTPQPPESKPKVPAAAGSGPKLPPSPESKPKVPAATASGPKLPPDSKDKPDSKDRPATRASVEPEPPTVRPSGEDKILARSPQPPAAVPKPSGPSRISRPTPSKPPPPPKSIKPPPPQSGRPPPFTKSGRPPPLTKSGRPPPLTKSVKPPPPSKQNVEELSGSMLLADPSAWDAGDGVEELSGSILLADASSSQKAQSLSDASASQKTRPVSADASDSQKTRPVSVDVSDSQKTRPVAIDPSASQRTRPLAAVEATLAAGRADASSSQKTQPMAIPGPSDSQKTRPVAVSSGHGHKTRPVADAGGQMVTVPMKAIGAPPKNGTDELSGSFLLDAGSTGALPSVDSESALRVTSPYEPPRAPFAAPPPAAGEPASREPSLAGPFAMPLGPASVPPSEPAPVSSSSYGFTPPLEDRVTVPRVTQPSVETAAEAASGHAPATVIGVPPPPDLLALAQMRPGSTSAVHVPPAAPPAAYVPAAPAPPNAFPSAAPPGPFPSAAPQPEGSSRRLHDFRALSPDPRMKIILPALGLLGTCVMLGLIGLIVGLFRKKPGDEPLPAEHAAETVTAPQASAAPPPALPGAVNLGGACALAGGAHVIAPRAVVQSGVEAQVVGAHVALGFASAPRSGIAVALDATSLSAAQTARVKAPDAIRRLVPIAAGRGLGAAADVDRDGDPLAGRRTVSDDAPFDLGHGAGGVAWAPYKSRELDAIWPLDGDAPVEALRAAPLDPASHDAGWAVAFRRGTSIFAGAITGGATHTAKGPLVRVDSLGPQIGSPAVAAQDGAVLVAWADRASASDPWSLRWMRFAPGDATADAKGFVPGEGGLGEHAMSPAIAPAGQGRFVLAWTEGPVSSHQVRAQTLSGAGAAIGKPFAVSEAGVNAGQAQLAILPDGHGVVAYLASTDSGPKAAYQVVATPIACP